MVANEDIPLQQAIGSMLLANGKTMCTAESCTGGYLAHLITSIPGSSKYFIGSVVSYDNKVKENLLSVKQQTLQSVGAVSEETAIEMAEGARRLIDTDFAVAISGIMGPNGGSDEKPVGTVWIAVASNTETVAQKFHVRYDRLRNIEITAVHALNMLRQSILHNI
jgi:nicotinamide-nucleotide amidase